MNMDNLDRILTSDELIEPSTSFSGNVMSRVETEAAPRAKIAFPWMRYSVVMIIAAILIIPLFPSEIVVGGLYEAFLNIGKWIVSPVDVALRNAFLLAMASLFGTMLLVFFSFRLAGSER